MGRLNAPVNWSRQMENFIDSYPLDGVKGINPDTDLAHAVQKDAVQNSLDAIDEEKPENFTVKFRVDNIMEPQFLEILDSGTTGLTGRPSLSRSELERLSEEKYRKEKWSRMQALGYSHPELGEERGARGQGKFIFIGSSEDGEMVFDTLRKDGVYRVGQWETGENKPLMKPKEGDEARKYVKERELEPLENIGTRVAIPNPRTEVWKSFWGLADEDESDLYKYISSTWWEALYNGRSIVLEIDDKISKEVKPPKLYRHFEDDPKHFEHMQKKKVGKPFQDDFSGVMVKDLVIAYSEKEVPRELRGIALQRGEMTVERFDPTHGNPHLPSKLKNHVFGWLTLNKAGDRELKKTERASHYHFGQKKGSLALKLFGRNGWLSRKMEEFGEQLGYAAGGRDVTGSYNKAINLLNNMAKDIGYDSNTRLGGSTKKGDGGEKRKRKRYRLRPQIKLKYPTKGSRRVEFGEEVSNIRVRVANYSEHPMDYKLKMSLKKKEGLRTENEKEKITLVNNTGEIPKEEKTDWLGGQTIYFDEGDFDSGTYVISAVAQTKEGKHKRENRKLIYLDEDPPFQGGLIKEVKVRSLEPPSNRMQYITRMEEEKKITLFLNDIHPLYDLNTKEGTNEPKEEYVIRCGINAFLEHDLKGDGKIPRKKKLDRITELMDRSMEEFSSTIDETSKARQELLFDIFEDRK